MFGRLQLVVFIISALFATTAAHGQVQLVGEHLENPNIPELEAIHQKPVLYQPVLPKGASGPAPVLYFTPFFTLENNKDGSLKVDVSEPLIDGNPWQLRLTVLVSPNDLLDKIASSVRDAASKSEALRPYALLTAHSLIPVEFTRLSISETDEDGNISSAPTFKSFTSNGIITGQPISLFANFKSETEARARAGQLREKKSLLRFRVDYKLFARMTVSESTSHVNSVSIRNTDGVQSLSGAGRAFKASVSPGAGTIQIGNNDVLSREQEANFEAQVRNQIRADYVVERQEDVAFLTSQLDRFLTQASKEQQVSLDDVSKVMYHLSAYNFSPADLTPDKIQKLAVDAKNALQTEDQSKFAFSGSASASFLGFGGSAAASIGREELKKQMTDKGWVFGADTEAYVPKSLKIYVVDKNAMEAVKDIVVSVSQRQRGEQFFPAYVESDRGFAPAQGMTTLKSDDLAVLIKRVADVERYKVRVVASDDIVMGALAGGNPNSSHQDLNPELIKPGEGHILAAWATPYVGVAELAKIGKLHVEPSDATHVHMMLDGNPGQHLLLRLSVYAVVVPD